MKLNESTERKRVIQEWDPRGRDYLWRLIVKCHDLQNEACPECPYDAKPVKCQCGGWIHCAQSGDWEEQAMAKRCTECGGNWEYIGSSNIHAKVADPQIEEKVAKRMTPIIDWMCLWILHGIGKFADWCWKLWHHKDS